MRNSILILSLFVFGFAAPSRAAEKKTVREAVVLMPLRPTKDIPQDEMTQYEAALVKSLSGKYVVYSGPRVLEKVNEVYKKRSGEATAGKECDETKCLQDIAIALQTELVAVVNIRKSGGGYSISLVINDVTEDKSVFSEQRPCKGCDEFQVMEVLQTLAGGGVASQAVAEAPIPQTAKGAGGNDMEITFWNSIKDSTNTADFEAYLQAYPNGTFVPLAKSRAKSPAQVAAEKVVAERVAAEEGERVIAEKAATEKAAAEKAATEKLAALLINPPEGMVAVKRGDSGFLMDKTEVTEEAYNRVIGGNPQGFKTCPTCPVEGIVWGDADAYCKKVGKRLPTDDEWEYAATSGGKGETFAGTSNNREVGNYAWYKENSGEGIFFDGTTHPVGKKKPNGLGLYDMSGNVWEWTDSWYDDSKKKRVVRGGSWFTDANFLKTALRTEAAPVGWGKTIGFRCVQ